MPFKIDVATTMNVTIASRRHFQSQPMKNVAAQQWQAISRENGY